MSNLFAAPRRCFRGRGVFLVVVAGVFVGGCAAAPAVVLPPTKSAKTAAKTAKNQSLNAALSKIDGATVTAWINRFAAPSKAQPAALTPQVRIDAEVLARRHPAFLLALSLERGEISPAAPQIAQVLAFSPAKSWLDVPAASQIASESMALPVAHATILRSGGANEALQKRQNAALQRFFAAASARDARRTREENLLARRALDDSLAQARQSAVGELDLTLVPPDVALELTNLRLQLLRNVSRTPAQRAASREAIRVIEDRYAEIWRQQTALQAERMRELTVEIPARQNREGVTKIALETAGEIRARAAARREVAAQTSRQLAADFKRSKGDLAFELPATPRLSPLFPIRQIAARRDDSQFFETPLPILPSASALQQNLSFGAARGVRGALVERLKNQARRDAREWARLLAAQMGARLGEGDVPNRTGEAVAQLFGATR